MSSSEVSKYIWVAFIVVSRFSDVWYQSLSQRECASARVVAPVLYCQASYPWSCNKRESIILRVLVITCNTINHLCYQRNTFFLCDWAQLRRMSIKIVSMSGTPHKAMCPLTKTSTYCRLSFTQAHIQSPDAKMKNTTASTPDLLLGIQRKLQDIS